MRPVAFRALPAVAPHICYVVECDHDGTEQARIAELEAEVERRGGIIRDLMRLAHVSIPEFELRVEGVNPSGDTLGRKERDDG